MATLEIIFEKERCRARVTRKNQRENDYVTESIISNLFENKEDLPKTIEALKPLYEKNMRVVVSIPSQEVMTRDFELDMTLNDAEIMKFLSSKSTQFFGYPSEKLCLDYETFHQNETTKQKITVIAAHKSLIHTIQNTFQEKKFPIHFINVDDNNISINLLPWREKKAKRKQKKNFLICILFAIIAFIFMMTFKYIFLNLTHHYAVKTLAINKKNSQIVLDHPNQSIVLLQQLKSIHIKKTAAIKTNQITENLLSAIATALPNTITLKSLYFNSHSIKMSGISDQLSTIHAYSDALLQKLTWNKISVTEIHNDLQNKPQMDFTIQATP